MLRRMTLRELTRVGFVRLASAAGLGAALLALSGCNKVEAKTPGPAPMPLAIPDPPPRMFMPVEVTPPLPPPPAAEKPAATSTQPPRTTPRPSPTVTPAPPATSAGETAPPPVVQTADQAQNEARARDHLQKAEGNLSKVKRAALPAAAKDQFDQAEKFVRMAKQALEARNFVYALSCAEKAATLAALLVKG